MNWKDTPNLFANGKFKVQTRGGYECEIKAFFIRDNLLQITFGDTTTVDEPKYLKLIARPIEDMTDEEIEKMYPTGDFSNKSNYEATRKWLVNASGSYEKGQDANYDRMSRTEQNMLLSIGVYPFPDTEDVIFKPK